MQKFKKFLIDNLKIVPKERFKKSELTESLNQFENLFQNNQFNFENEFFFKEKYEVYDLALNSLILWNLSLTNILLKESQELKHNPIPTQKEYFTHLQIHLTNNLLSVKHLFNLGLDTQAKNIYRNSIEISDLALCILNKKDFFEIHIKPQLNKKGNPYISPKNKTLQSQAEHVMIGINKHLKNETKNIIEVCWKEIRKEHYSSLSESAHGNFFQNTQNSLKKTHTNKFIPSIGGGKWLGMEKSLSDICLHQIASKGYLTWSLDLNNNIDLFDNSTVPNKLIWFLDFVIGKKLLKELIEPMIPTNE
ncbi:hypothetical protein [Tenacibaculum ovolyticum]|uniref:hypothetical protein n=1 Tax=Tenacibaculum ovolyticum TaxID=104270 RepID=UPI0004003B11|nr:hypothetical protein [Tenacibaculum ovolyticum]